MPSAPRIALWLRGRSFPNEIHGFLDGRQGRTARPRHAGRQTMTSLEKTACPAPCCLAASRLGRSLDRGIFGLGEFARAGRGLRARAPARPARAGLQLRSRAGLGGARDPYRERRRPRGRVCRTDTREADFARALRPGSTSASASRRYADLQRQHVLQLGGSSRADPWSDPCPVPPR